MQLTPRYDTDPVIVLDGPPGAIAEPAIRQRRRLLDTVRGFDSEQWARPSRCEGWSNRDVIAHLDTTNGFWSFAIDAGRRGEPTRFLATFDPVTSPAHLVADAQDLSDDEVFARFESSTTDLIDLLTVLDSEAWTLPAEAPPSHLATTALVHHALWDSWVRERDILLPLGTTPGVEADEVAACLRYAAALGPAFAANDGATTTGTLAVVTTDPEVAFEVTIAHQVHVRSVRPHGTGRDGPTPYLVLTGPAVDLLEAFSIRGPFPPVRDDQARMLSGLARAFDA
ncbi:maleylpyruvate isomerase N-terminal domain-containing protein [Iamia sp.]|uniref:maleylpyruvate isomerase N-terminal domain-containing protein n=1 Tax=Iamia sp. TaxID=2722710 RepID=UPI002BADA78F|nr:maleylpyruvate isomerase N-terminal domain-containing protein [Iamia sp.]HXH56539.1 maleylpyruvate isomerase N-terminal domain-containing protein [Iamia sp.]